ncbi:MAG: hypothetical protein U0I22_10695 [Treponema sp.]|nr:hypothetical protein [Treponema sp.]
MKSFATIVTLAGLLFCLFSCDEGKSGPFTFTNNTEETVYVLIDQDGVLEKEFTDGEKYQGKDYFIPKITFVKGFSSETDKSIVDNRYTATTNNGFDYSFVKVEEYPEAEKYPLVISFNLGGDFSTNPAIKDGCTLRELSGKLGEYSNTEIELTSGMSSPVSKQLYTDSPVFRIYNNAKQDVTDLFTIAVGKSEIPPVAPKTSPTVQWNLEITYPKVAIVQN